MEQKGVLYRHVVWHWRGGGGVGRVILNNHYNYFGTRPLINLPKDFLSSGSASIGLDVTK